MSDRPDRDARRRAGVGRPPVDRCRSRMHDCLAAALADEGHRVPAGRTTRSRSGRRTSTCANSSSLPPPSVATTTGCVRRDGARRRPADARARPRVSRTRLSAGDAPGCAAVVSPAWARTCWCTLRGDRARLEVIPHPVPRRPRDGWSLAARRASVGRRPPDRRRSRRDQGRQARRSKRSRAGGGRRTGRRAPAFARSGAGGEVAMLGAQLAFRRPIDVPPRAAVVACGLCSLPGSDSWYRNERAVLELSARLRSSSRRGSSAIPRSPGRLGTARRQCLRGEPRALADREPRGDARGRSRTAPDVDRLDPRHIALLEPARCSMAR